MSERTEPGLLWAGMQRFLSARPAPFLMFDMIDAGDTRIVLAEDGWDGRSTHYVIPFLQKIIIKKKKMYTQISEIFYRKSDGPIFSRPKSGENAVESLDSLDFVSMEILRFENLRGGLYEKRVGFHSSFTVHN